jgi:hypothetical protein
MEKAPLTSPPRRNNRFVQRGIVDQAFFFAGIEGRGIRNIQLCAFEMPERKIGVGEERRPERNEISNVAQKTMGRKKVGASLWPAARDDTFSAGARSTTMSNSLRVVRQWPACRPATLEDVVGQFPGDCTKASRPDGVPLKVPKLPMTAALRPSSRRGARVACSGACSV